MQSPFYTFSNSKGRELKKLKINLNKTYRFHRLDEATSHPFYVGDSGVNQPSTSALKLSGDGSPLEGIADSGSFKLSFRKSKRRELKREGVLEYFCTTHPSMLGTLKIKGAKKSKRDQVNIDKEPIVAESGLENLPSSTNLDVGQSSDVEPSYPYYRIDSTINTSELPLI